MRRVLDCAVIGAGPGGLVSALYLRRFRREVAVFDSGDPRARWIPELRNLIGHVRGISGRALLARLRKQVAALGAPVVEGHAKVYREGKGFRVVCGRRVFRAKKVILATGIEDNQLRLPNLAALRRAGLLRYCPICDAFERARGQVCLLVADEACVRRALFLRHFTRHLTVILPPEARLSPARARELRRLGVAVVQEKVTGIEANRRRNGIFVCFAGRAPAAFDAAYVELGFRLRDGAFAHLRGIRRAKSGLLVVSCEQRLSAPGLFAVGDCVNRLAQVSVAAGQAAVAATAVHNELLDEEASEPAASPRSAPPRRRHRRGRSGRSLRIGRSKSHAIRARRR